MNNHTKKQVVIHDDFTNLLINTPGADDPQNLAKAARRELLSETDIISLAVGVNEGMCYYCPTDVGGILGANGDGNVHGGAMMRALVSAGADPFGIVLNELRKGKCKILAKFRVNDCHHVAGHPGLASQFWKEHPEWRIGNVEASAGSETMFSSCSCLGPMERNYIAQRRGSLLDYAIPKVREYRLSVVKEFMRRYDVDGLTLNFLREPYCISFPSQNAPLLTGFIAECRKIVEEAIGKRGKSTPIMGAIVPWDLNYCRVMGLEVDKWIGDGLLDYISPTDTWVTEFNMVIEPWVKLASSTCCAVYPGIIGFTSFGNDVCLPEEYEPEGRGVDGKVENSSKVTHENIRALAHRFYAEGADGVSFFNFYSAFYHKLYPLPETCLPERIEGKERRYIYMKRAALFSEWPFLQFVLPVGSLERRAVRCRLHEDLKKVDAFVRFKVHRLTDIGLLRVDINNREIPEDKLSLIPHGGEGFLYARFQLEEGMLRDGDNEIGFAFRDVCAAVNRDVIIQEVEIRVVPR